MKKFIIIFLGFLISCTNPFSTRGPDPPKNSNILQNSSDLQNHRDSLLAKLKYAFKERNENYYKECFADTLLPGIKTEYVFVPQQDETNRFSGWGLQDEYNYFFSLINIPDQLSLELQIYNDDEWTEISASPDTLQKRFYYLIEINFQTGKEIYEGQSIFKILRSPKSLWYIFYWEDLKINSENSIGTWSTLKANYR